MSALNEGSPGGGQGGMIVHMARLLNDGVINERAYELAVKQLVLNSTPTGVNKGSPTELNSGGKNSSNRKLFVTPLPSREGVGKGGVLNGEPSIAHHTPSTANNHNEGKGKEPMLEQPTSTFDDNKDDNVFQQVFYDEDDGFNYLAPFERSC